MNRMFFFIALYGVLLPATMDASELQHERLRIRNTFKTPEEVVGYYCGRDSSGFVWSGLLDAERKAFTLWTEVPQHDTFFIASKYDIQPGQQKGDRAIVKVRYQIAALGDGHGTRSPAPPPERVVEFELRRVDGVWKIAEPKPAQMPPVVLEAKFPTVAGI